MQTTYYNELKIKMEKLLEEKKEKKEKYITRLETLKQELEELKETLVTAKQQDNSSLYIETQQEIVKKNIELKWLEGKEIELKQPLISETEYKEIIDKLRKETQKIMIKTYKDIKPKIEKILSVCSETNKHIIEVEKLTKVIQDDIYLDKLWHSNDYKLFNLRYLKQEIEKVCEHYDKSI